MDTIKFCEKWEPKFIIASATKTGKNVTNILNFYFSKQIYPLAHKINLYIQKTKFISYKQYLCGLLFSKSVKWTHTDQSILHFSVLSLKGDTNHNSSNEAAATNLFSSVYITDITCFDKCCLFYLTTGEHHFNKSL